MYSQKVRGIKKLKGRRQNTQKKQTLKDPAGKQTLDKLHEDYVLAPAAKAGNNVIICKQYYKEMLTKEHTNNSGASTYLCCNETVDQIIDSHVDFMRRNNIKIPEDLAKLPNFYWMPKLHKNRYGHRFIAASSTCTTKPLSRLLKQCMTKLITENFSCRNANYIQIHSGRAEACWGTDTSTCNKAGTYSLTDGQVIELFNFLINNDRSVVFQQAIGIPMGTNCAPLIADLFLFSFEFEFIKKLIRTDISVANKTFRYM